MYSLSNSNWDGLCGKPCHIIAVPPGPPVAPPLLRVKARAHSGCPGPACAPLPLYPLQGSAWLLPLLTSARVCFSGPVPFTRKLPQSAGLQTFNIILLDLDKQIWVANLPLLAGHPPPLPPPTRDSQFFTAFSTSRLGFISSSQGWNVSLITGESNYHSF